MGRGIAEAVGEAGAFVVAGDLQFETVAETIGIIKARGSRGLAIELDVTSNESVADAVRRAVSEFGRLDGLVNNAGVCRMGSALEARTEDRDIQHAVNVEGLYSCCQLAVRQMMEQESGGAIVNIASEAGRGGYLEQARSTTRRKLR